MSIGQFKAMWQCIDATWWPTLEPMQVGPPHVQILNQCKLCQFATVCKWPNLQSVQIAPSGDQNVQTLDEASYGGKIFPWWKVAPSSGQIRNQFKVVLSGGQICNKCKWRHLVAKFAINAILLPNLIQVTESISGSVVPLAMFFLQLTKQMVFPLILILSC